MHWLTRSDTVSSRLLMLFQSRRLNSLSIWDSYVCKVDCHFISPSIPPCWCWEQQGILSLILDNQVYKCIRGFSYQAKFTHFNDAVIQDLFRKETRLVLFDTLLECWQCQNLPMVPHHAAKFIGIEGFHTSALEESPLCSKWWSCIHHDVKQRVGTGLLPLSIDRDMRYKSFRNVFIIHIQVPLDPLVEEAFLSSSLESLSSNLIMLESLRIDSTKMSSVRITKFTRSKVDVLWFAHNTI